MTHSGAKSGVSLAEYGLVLSLVACLSFIGLQSLGSSLFDNLQATAQKINAVSGESGTLRGGGASDGLPTGSPPPTILGAGGMPSLPPPDPGIQKVKIDPVSSPYTKTQVGASAASFTSPSASSEEAPTQAVSPYSSATVLGTAGTKRRE